MGGPGLWRAGHPGQRPDLVSVLLASAHSAAGDVPDPRSTFPSGIVSAPVFRWVVVGLPPALLVAALMPPAVPLRWRRRTLRLAGGVVVAIAVLLLLGCVLPLLDVPMNVKT